MKNHKKTVIFIIVLLIVAIVAVAIVFAMNNKKDEGTKENGFNTQEQDDTQKTVKLKEKLDQTQNYKVSLVLNDENQRITSRKGEQAKIEIVDEGAKTTYLVSKGTTYMTIEETGKEYKYENNTSLLNDFLSSIEEISNLNYETGKETIEGKEYNYEEFNRTALFAINYKTSIEDSISKTRMYFEGNNLKYIKTYIGNVEQLLKVEIEYNNQKDSDF